MVPGTYRNDSEVLGKYVDYSHEVLGQYLERFGTIHLGEVGKFALPNRFRYWDLKEAATDGTPYGLSKIGVAPVRVEEARGVGGNGFRIMLWVNEGEAEYDSEL